MAEAREIPPGAVVLEFWPKVDRLSPAECWEWLGPKHNGYGRFSFSGRSYVAHRFAYEFIVGPIPEGLTIDHLCRNRGCVNPNHLEPCSAVENAMRGESPPARNARKTHCKDGHPLSGENLGQDKRGRVCLTCKRKESERIKRAKGVPPLRRSSRQLGVFIRKNGKWGARGPQINGERAYYGEFDREEDAVAVVQAARIAAGWPVNSHRSAASMLEVTNG